MCNFNFTRTKCFLSRLKMSESSSGKNSENIYRSISSFKKRLFHNKSMKMNKIPLKQ